MAALAVDRAPPGWRFWLLWMGASIAAAVAYTLFIPVVFGIINALAPMQQVENLAPEQRWIGIAFGLLGSGALGAAIGLAQWWVMRKYLSRVGWWVLATLIGYAVPLSLGPLIPVREPWLAGLSVFLMFGVILGILQWLTLRGRVQKAGWWIAVSVGGWLLPYALTDIAYLSGVYVEPFDLLSAYFIPVAVAGAGMIWLLRRSIPVIPAIG